MTFFSPSAAHGKLTVFLCLYTTRFGECWSPRGRQSYFHPDCLPVKGRSCTSLYPTLLWAGPTMSGCGWNSPTETWFSSTEVTSLPLQSASVGIKPNLLDRLQGFQASGHTQVSQAAPTCAVLCCQLNMQKEHMSFISSIQVIRLFSALTSSYHNQNFWNK